MEDNNINIYIIVGLIGLFIGVVLAIFVMSNIGNATVTNGFLDEVCNNTYGGGHIYHDDKVFGVDIEVTCSSPRIENKTGNWLSLEAQK